MPPRAVRSVWVGLVALLVAALWIGLNLGSVADPSREIVLTIRLPRVCLAALVGSGLGAAGALLQPLMRNPLADPFLLGISGGAALGGVLAAALGDVLGWTVLAGALGLPLSAFAGAVLATLLLYAFSTLGGQPASSQSLLLCGVVFNAVASAAIIFLLTLVELDQVAGAFLWLMGAIRPIDTWLLGVVAAVLVVSLAVGVYDAHALNLMSLGDEMAAQLGVDTQRVRGRILLATAALVGSSVAVAGIVGFVGLIVPHLLRGLLGADNRRIVPASALLGAGLVVLADTCARTVLAPTELPVGAFSALLGGPIFFVLLRRELVRGTA